jgi:dihydroxy-acid dehydratase
VVKELEPFIHKHALTVNGQTLWNNCQAAENFNPEVIKSLARPFSERGGIVVLRGNLAPNGAVLKPSAATPSLMQHTGRAVVFEDITDYKQRVDDPDLDVEPQDILVLKNCGPKGYPGFPEVGNMALPKKLLERGVTDMVRISDARMSGTAYGTVVLHTAPEAAIGGPLALVKSGDVIELDVAARSLTLHVSELELEMRRQSWQPPLPEYERGYYKLFRQHVMQADRGVDFDFLVGKSGAPVPRDSH